MTKGVLIAATTIVAMAEPVLADSGDLLRYAITQGGLLAVVFVLLWSYRKDTLGALNLERERVSILTDLVASTKTAIVSASDVIAAQAKSIDGLARVVEKIDDRRSVH